MADRVRSRRFIALGCACSLFVTACGGGSTGPELEAAETATPVTPDAAVARTSLPEPTTRRPAADRVDSDQLAAIAGDVAPSDGAVLVAVIGPSGEAVAGSAGADDNGNAPTADDAFRVGSITKVFTSLATLTLVDQGSVDLDAAAADYLTRVAVDADITVRDLLRHRTGIDNYTDLPGFFASVFAEPERVWAPEEPVDLVADRPPLFAAGSQFSYSNTNYSILGILIEEVTGQPYHHVVRERLIDPLGMTSTYLAGHEEGAEPFDPFVEQRATSYDYTSIATAAWSAGAFVSSAPDLHVLFAALFDGQIVSEALVDEMTVGSPYGLGVELDSWERGIVSHSGGIPGYITFVAHAPEFATTAFVASTDERANTRAAIDAVLALLAVPAEEGVTTAAEPAPNDLFQDALVVDPSALPFVHEVDTTGATTDADDAAVGCPAPAADASVWYSITPTSDVRLLVGADGSDYSVGVSALTEDDGSFALIECRPFAFVVDAQADVTYHFQVFDGQEDGTGNGGNLTFSMEEAP